MRPTSETIRYFVEAYPFDAGDIDGAEIASAVVCLQMPGGWLDMGCGPILPIWAAFARTPANIVGLDVLAENIAFLRSQIGARQIEEPHRRALAFASKHLGLEVLEQHHAKSLLFDRISELHQANVTDQKSSWNGSFGLVTQIGCFGCLESREQFLAAARIVADYLAPGGRFLSISWIQPKYDGIKSWNGPISSRLTLKQVCDDYRHVGLSILDAREVPTRDQGYTAMLRVSCEKPAG
ncbi:MAG: hypothetical protein HC869_01185 [Rhodospirillales bacterium]|nr:hypothetical protein [Rhodospirillales bacterium]